jgi:hypothetical protein
MDAKSRKRQRNDLSFLSDVWLDAVLGERRLSGNSQYRNRQLRRPTFSASDHRGLGAVTSPVGFLTARHAAKARCEGRIVAVASSLRFGGYAADRVHHSHHPSTLPSPATISSVILAGAQSYEPQVLDNARLLVRLPRERLENDRRFRRVRVIFPSDEPITKRVLSARGVWPNLNAN